MKLWLDAQLPPSIAEWIATEFGVECPHIRATPWARADDLQIFTELRQPGHVIVTKDEDFADIVTRLDPPPQVLCVRLGNLTNRSLRQFFGVALTPALDLLRAGEPLVEMHRTPE